MTEFIAQLRAYLLLLLRFRWQGLALAWLICLAGWSVVAALPDQYVSTARVYVESESMVRNLTRGIAIDTTLLSQVEYMQRTLLSKPNLVKVAQATGLDSRAKTPAQMDDLVASVGRRLKFTPQGKNLMALTYEDRDAKMAKAVLDAILNLFMESNIGAARRDTIAAIRFIDEKIREYELQLEAAENKVAAFKSENMGFLPGDGNYGTRLETARLDVARTEAEVKERMLKRDAMRQRLGEIPRYVEAAGSDVVGAGPPMAVGPAGAVLDLTVRIAELEKNLDELLRKYTDRHPDVLATRRALERLRKQAREYEQLEKSASAAGGQSGSPPSGKPTVPNPIYSQVEVQLITEDSEIAALQGRLERQRAEMRKWEQLARNMPNVAAEMERLNRDYAVLKKNYDELVTRREAAKMGQDLDEQTDKIQIRIVEPPQMPAKPTGPKRTLFLAAVWAFALATGIVAAVALGIVTQCVATVAQLKGMVDLPVLGGVSTVGSPFQRRRRMAEHVAFGAMTLALLGAFGGIMVLEMLRGFKIPVV